MYYFLLYLWIFFYILLILEKFYREGYLLFLRKLFKEVLWILRDVCFMIFLIYKIFYL